MRSRILQYKQSVVKQLLNPVCLHSIAKNNKALGALKNTKTKLSHLSENSNSMMQLAANNTSTSASFVPGNEGHPGADTTVLIPLSVTWAVLGLVSTILNIIVCLIVMSDRRLWTITNSFIVSLSVADLLIAAALIPIYICENFTLTQTPITGYVIAFLLLASIFNIGAVTYERYVALTRPLGYRVTMNTTRVAVIISLCWVVPFCISILPVAWDADPTTKYHKVYMIVTVFGFVLLPCLVMIWIYVRLLRVVRRFISRNRRRSTWGNRTGERAGNEDKAVIVFAMIFGMFLLSWMPLIYINICEIFDQLHLITAPVLYASFYTLLFNTIMDPLIYAFLKKDFGESLKRRWKKENNNTPRGESQVEITMIQSQIKRMPSWRN